MFTLTIYFIALYVYVEFVLIYRPHPVYKEIQKGSVKKSYMTNGLLKYSMVKYLRISSYISKPFPDI
jgi:hypothetical protein